MLYCVWEFFLWVCIFPLFFPPFSCAINLWERECGCAGAYLHISYFILFLEMSLVLSLFLHRLLRIVWFLFDCVCVGLESELCVKVNSLLVNRA